MMDSALSFISVILLLSVAPLAIWIVIRVTRESVAWHAEQRLYGVRDIVYKGVLDGQWSFDDREVKDLVDFIHFGIEMARDRALRHEMIDRMVSAKKDSPTNLESEGLSFFGDARFMPLGMQAFHHANKCIIVETISRFSVVLVPVLAVFLIAFLSTKAAAVFQRMASQFMAEMYSSGRGPLSPA